MSNKKLCKGKHLRIEDRLIIEHGLDQNYTLKEIAEIAKKDPTTISKEINAGVFFKDAGWCVGQLIYGFCKASERIILS